MRSVFIRLSAVLSLTSLPGHARENEASFSLDYSVPEGCPARAAFVQAVVSRSQGAEERPSAAARVRLSVSLTGTAPMTSGWLTLQLADGQESRREIPAAPCDEVLASMALISAMILEGASLDAPVPTTTEAPSLAGPPQAPTKQLVQRARPERRERSVWPRERPRPPEPAQPQHRASRLRYGVAVSAVADSAVAPNAAFGAAGGVDVSLDTRDLFAPSLRMEGRFAATALHRTPHGDADFRLYAGAVSACALRFALLTRFAMRACGVVEAGELQGKGTNTLNPATKSMLWLGFGAAPRLEAALGSWAALELEGRVSALVEHDRFLFAPDVVVHDVPAVATALRLGLVLRLP